MKIIFLMLLACLPIQAEDWTVNGKTYHNVIVGQVEADVVHVAYDGGIGRISLADLPSDLQKKFDYDPAKARAASAIRRESSKPDWEKISDKFLVGLVPEVERETANASTEMERLHAESSQNILLIFHKVYAGKNISDDDGKVLNKWASCVMHNQICVGMPKDLVSLSWGDPETDTTTTNGDGDDWETMTFGHWASTVFIAGGVVKNITQTETANTVNLSSSPTAP